MNINKSKEKKMKNSHESWPKPKQLTKAHSHFPRRMQLQVLNGLSKDFQI